MCWQRPKLHHPPPPSISPPALPTQPQFSGAITQSFNLCSYLSPAKHSALLKLWLQFQLCLHHMHLVTPSPTLQPLATVTSWNSVCARHLITCADVIKILFSFDIKDHMCHIQFSLRAWCCFPFDCPTLKLSD